VRLAQKFNGEIINADSRQVYRYMDIGTAKPAREELAQAPHHLFNLIDPDTDFSLAQYQKQAHKIILDVQSRRKIPFLVGGSGQYVWAVLEGWEIPHVAPDPELRRKLEKTANENGIDGLYSQLKNLDPAAALKIDPRNIRRVIRALEVTMQTRTPFSQLQKKHPLEYPVLIIGLTADRSDLYRRVDARVDEMVNQGLIIEVENLINKGYNLDLPSLNTIGYQQIGNLLKGDIDKEEAIRQIKTATHRFVRHQYAWFHLNDSRICWFDISNDIWPAVLELVENYCLKLPPIC
jgi:tRNA dimethylallyltransferase